MLLCDSLSKKSSTRDVIGLFMGVFTSLGIKRRSTVWFWNKVNS